MTLNVVSSNEDDRVVVAANEKPGLPPVAVMTEEMGPEVKDQMTSSQDSGISMSHSAASQHATGGLLGSCLRITACANQGGRRYMEDRVHVHVERNAETGEIDWTFVAVYDGHGGPEASEYCRRWLLKNIQKQAGFDSEDDDEFLEAIRSGFLNTHHLMWKEVDNWDRTASGYASTAGTTASCAFIRRGKLYVGHVGDSAILLTTRTHPDRYFRLTEDHKPETPSERRRIEASGGSVAQKAFVHRVVWTRPTAGHVGPVRRTTPVQTIPFLAVARSLGDFWSYCEETQEFAVSPNPDVCVRQLTPDDYAIVLASDGLTNVMSDDLEAGIMHGLATEERDKQWFTDPSEQPNHARIVMRRVMLGWKRYRADNVSVLAVVFDDPSTVVSSSQVAEDMDEEKKKEEEDDSDLPEEVPLQQSIDLQLCDYPLSLFQVTNSRVLRYRTAPVQMAYGGMFDNNFHSVSSVGPGFLSHNDEKLVTEAAFADDDEEEEEMNETKKIGEDMVDGVEKENTMEDEDENRSTPSLTRESRKRRAERLEEYYDMLGVGERDVTPENRPPTTSTKNLTNTGGAGGMAYTMTSKKSTVTVAASGGKTTLVEMKKTAFTSAAAAIIDEMRRDEQATLAAVGKHVAAAASTADSAPSDERPTTPENRGDVGYAVLRASRSTGKRKSRIFDANESTDVPSTSSVPAIVDGAGERMEEEEEAIGSENEGSPEHEPLLLLSLPFEDEEEERRQQALLRTPSPIGDAIERADGEPFQDVRATPLCNTTATEREVERRVTRSAAAAVNGGRRKEMVIVHRPANIRRSSARQLLKDGDTGAAAPAPTTPKVVLEIGETIATRTRSRAESQTPPTTTTTTPAATSAVLSAIKSSGSRKRPRAVAGGAITTTTPLLAKLALSEINENVGCSSSESVAPSSTEAATPLKWKRCNRKPLVSSSTL